MAYFPLPESGFPDFWKALDAKLLTLGQLLGYPWKVLGMTVQMSYVEGCLWNSDVFGTEVAQLAETLP